MTIKKVYENTCTYLPTPEHRKALLLLLAFEEAWFILLT
jgi:hypothetical protein